MSVLHQTVSREGYLHQKVSANSIYYSLGLFFLRSKMMRSEIRPLKFHFSLEVYSKFTAIHDRLIDFIRMVCVAYFPNAGVTGSTKIVKELVVGLYTG